MSWLNKKTHDHSLLLAIFVTVHNIGVTFTTTSPITFISWYTIISDISYERCRIRAISLFYDAELHLYVWNMLQDAVFLNCGLQTTRRDTHYTESHLVSSFLAHLPLYIPSSPTKARYPAPWRITSQAEKTLVPGHRQPTKRSIRKGISLLICSLVILNMYPEMENSRILSFEARFSKFALKKVQRLSSHTKWLMKSKYCLIPFCPHTLALQRSVSMNFWSNSHELNRHIGFTIPLHHLTSRGKPLRHQFYQEISCPKRWWVTPFL